MPYIFLLIAGGLLLFGNKIAKPKDTGTDAANKGGTSTPIPDKFIPPFYQWNNAATPAVPKTILGFKSTEGLPVESVPHNNVILSGTFDASTSAPVRVPISGDLINDTEQTSVAEEQATSWQNNRVGGSNVRQVLA